MARRGNSVIGIDLGKHSFKGVLLQRKSDSRFVLTGFATREIPEEISTTEELSQQIKLLLREIGGSAKNCAVAASDPTALLRIIEQPNTPVDLLRSALRLNGLAVLNQECKDFVLDIAPVAANNANGRSATGASGGIANPTGVMLKTKYLVGGLLRSVVKQISEAVNKTRLSADILQLAPVCSFNAFELAYPETFAKEAFLLLDMGHLQSTVLIGNKRELVLVRSIDYVGKSLRRLATEVRNSIGFFEGQHEESINRIFVSGGLARAEIILQTLSDELGLPCEIWDPLETCEVALSAAKRQELPNQFVSLNAACGAAFEYLRN